MSSLSLSPPFLTYTTPRYKDQESGLSAYQVPNSVNPQNQTNFSEDSGFPVNWDPRYTAAWGFAAQVDAYSNFRVHNSSRKTSTKNDDGSYSAKEADSPDGFLISGNLPVTDDQGVHSVSLFSPAAPCIVPSASRHDCVPGLSLHELRTSSAPIVRNMDTDALLSSHLQLADVNVYSWGGGHEDFRGIMNSPDIANKIAHALCLGKDKNVTYSATKSRGQVKL